MRCLPALEEDIACAGYKILKTLDKVRCKAVDTADANHEDKLFININNMKDYETLSL